MVLKLKYLRERLRNQMLASRERQQKVFDQENEVLKVSLFSVACTLVGKYGLHAFFTEYAYDRLRGRMKRHRSGANVSPRMRPCRLKNSLRWHNEPIN